MFQRLERYGDLLLQSVDRMDSQQWIIISVVAVVLGALLLRGFGSRTNY